MLSLLYLGVKAQQYFVSSSCMFLDKKTLLKVWLNLVWVKLNRHSRNRALAVLYRRVTDNSLSSLTSDDLNFLEELKTSVCQVR